MVDSNNETIKRKKIVVKKKEPNDDNIVITNFRQNENDELDISNTQSRVRKKAVIEENKETLTTKVEVVTPKKQSKDLTTKLREFRTNRKKKNIDLDRDIPNNKSEIKLKKESKEVSEEKKNKKETTKKTKSNSKESKKTSKTTKTAKDTHKGSSKNNMKEKTKKESTKKDKLPDILFGNTKETNKTNNKTKTKGNKKNTKDVKNKTIENGKIKLDSTKKDNKQKRVLKPGVSKVFNIISDIMYWIIFAFIIVLLFIVCVQRFSNNELSVGGIRIYNVSTESMATKYEVGDIIIAKDVDPSTLKPGDDIAYNGKMGQLEGKIITHEIQSIAVNEDGTYTIITKGIQNDIEDPAINSSQVKGKIIRRLPILSVLSKIASNNFGLFFAIFVPVAIIIFMNMIRIMNSSDDEENK